MQNKSSRDGNADMVKRHDLHEDFENIKQKMRETRRAFAQTAYDVKDAAGDLWTQSLKDAKSRSTDFQENAITYVKANPVKSMGFALLAGFILGKLLQK